MAPGQSPAVGDVDIQNASSMDATFALADSHVTGTALAGSLNLRLTMTVRNGRKEEVGP